MYVSHEHQNVDALRVQKIALRVQLIALRAQLIALRVLIIALVSKLVCLATHKHWDVERVRRHRNHSLQ